MPIGAQLYVIDTSSLLNVRETFGGTNESKVFTRLTVLAEKSHILFPPEVCDELERGSGSDPDLPLVWARRHRECSERKPSFDAVREVLKAAEEVLDAQSPHEQADPYVVALAWELRRGGFEVTVVTDDRKDKKTKPVKLSVATAAGMLGIPTVPLFAFARTERLEPD